MSDSATSDLFSYLKEKSGRISEVRSEDEKTISKQGATSTTEEAAEDTPKGGDDSRAENEADGAADASDTAEATDLAFDDPLVGEKLRDASAEKRNAAPFGIIELDDEGTVQFFNRYESELSGVDPEKALGQNYFNELAPCSNNRIFYGRFREGIASGEMDEHFTYTFTYKMRPTLVDVHLYRDDAGRNWIMVRKR
ncbi:MAG: PAS domain-containing protein [Longimonas sp.]|uniref:PAS domain-containing protein n=1 Tax=Longimonas sp. TaxID=2039626 RepID=UPI00334BA1F2